MSMISLFANKIQSSQKNSLLTSPSNICILRSLCFPFPPGYSGTRILHTGISGPRGAPFFPETSWFLGLCQDLPTLRDLSKLSLACTELPAPSLGSRNLIC